MNQLLPSIQLWWRLLKYREGRVVSRFVARDVRRDIQVLSTSRIKEGVITGRVKTTNVLYVAKGLAVDADFDPPTDLTIARMWDWTGHDWGGLPDGSSIVDQ